MFISEFSAIKTQLSLRQVINRACEKHNNSQPLAGRSEWRKVLRLYQSRFPKCPANHQLAAFANATSGHLFPGLIGSHLGYWDVDIKMFLKFVLYLCLKTAASAHKVSICILLSMWKATLSSSSWRVLETNAMGMLWLHILPLFTRQEAVTSLYTASNQCSGGN